jgi:cytochrome oxidase Cu insertion factor (SCO1/SenC/PrrC family)
MKLSLGPQEGRSTCPVTHKGMSLTWPGFNNRRIAMDAEHPSELAIGDLAPDFTLRASNGHEIALDAYRGRQHVVLFFVRAYG